MSGGLGRRPLNLNVVKPVLTASEYRRVDQAYEGDVFIAMERAGLAVALTAARLGAAYGSRVAVLAGPGNNGGDGYVAARVLHQRGAGVVVYRLGEPRRPEAARAEARARAEGVRIEEIGTPGYYHLVIDAVFGGAARGGIPEVLVPWMESDVPVVAVDFPSGLDPDSGELTGPSFRANATVTFSTLKTGHVCGSGPDVCGDVVVADIGINGGRPSMWVAEEEDAPRPGRHRTAHKWSAGSVLVVGGSTGMIGAAVFAARSAVGFGAGTVYLASPRPELAQALAPEVPCLALDDGSTPAGKFDVAIVGPGLSDEDLGAALSLVQGVPRLVLDAGALRPDVVEAAVSRGAEVIVTPHAGEFKRLAGVGPGMFATRSYASKTGVTLLAKGNPTLVTDGGPPVLVTTGGPELATIGTGDVLAGMVGALWARGLGPRDAAVSGSYWHGVAGSRLKAAGSVGAPALVEEISRHAW